jgi:hypothetical protein
MRCEIGPPRDALRGRYQKKVRDMVQYAVADQFLSAQPRDAGRAQSLLRQKFADLSAETCPRKIRTLFNEMKEALRDA